WRPAAALPYLARALHVLGSADLDQRALLERAVAIAAGIAIDGTTDDGIVTQGQRLQVEVTVWNAGDAAVRVDSLDVRAPAGWTAERLDFGAASLGPGSVSTQRFIVGVARDAERTQPYFLRRPLTSDRGLYDWAGVPRVAPSTRRERGVRAGGRDPECDGRAVTSGAASRARGI